MNRFAADIRSECAARGVTPKRIVICAVRYSPNLGDGVLSDCLSHSLSEASPELSITHIDLAGRTRFGETSFRNRGLALKVLPALPLYLRQHLVQRVLGRKLDALEPGWRATIRDADLVVIGGGQLFADADLNFPLKVGRIARLCQEEQTPVAVYGAGVSGGWTTRGAHHFASLGAAELRHVALRDRASVEAFTRQMPSLSVNVDLVPDPAVVADAVYGPAPDQIRALGAGRVGLCVTSEEILKYHADTGIAGADQARQFFREVIDRLCSGGTGVALFTNGADEDEETLRALYEAPQLREYVADGRLIRQPRFGHPRELAHAISVHDVIVAHRLHASIVAHAYGVPSVGLGWDRKVQSFYELTGRMAHCVTDPALGAEELCNRIEAARRDPVTSAVRDALAARVASGIGALLGN